MQTVRLSLMAVAATLALGATAAQAASYEIDPAHTHTTFEIGHFGTSTNRARFDKTTGSIELDRAHHRGRVDVSIHTDTISSGTEHFDAHLKSADLFDSARYPTVRFVSDRFVFQGDKLVSVPGQLTLLGKTHPVTLKAVHFNCYKSPMFNGREVCGGEFETNIDRTQWGMDYLVKMGMPTSVHLITQIEAVQK